MAIRGKTPRGSEDQNHWNTDKLKPGERFEGWIAGDAICVTMHEAPTTKPCLKRYMGFDVPCPGCASRLKLCDITFFPVYREIVMKKCVVPLRCAAALQAEKFPLHHSVIVSRPMGRNEGRSIGSRTKQISFKVDPSCEMPKCIASWLPTLWGYGERITAEHLLRGPVFDVPADPVQAAAVAKLTEEQEIERMHELQRSYRAKRTSVSEAIGMGDVVKGYLGGVRVNETNGTGH